MSSKKILIVLGHPNSNSFNAALATSYQKGANQAGHKVKKLELGKLDFDPVIRFDQKKKLRDQKTIKKAQDLIRWADHLVFVFPYWWSSFPALLKGFFDRVFEPGFAFKFEGKMLWKRLLEGRTGRLVVTMDAPPILDMLILRSAGIRVVKFATLEFCGVKPVKVTRLGPIKSMSKKQAHAWLKKIEDMGVAGV